MASAWLSLQNEFPESVHDLMAMWGGFEASRDANGCGMEKRLELDFCRVIMLNDVAVMELEAVMSHAGEVLERCSTDKNLVCLWFSQSVMVLTAKRVVVTSASSVLLHSILQPLLDLLSTHNVFVEWASFMRMNTTSPWTLQEMSDIVAKEYAELKSAFPSGHPYLTGPVDQDHFFYFVYDAIERNVPDAPIEDDVQINIYMHNVKIIDGCGDDSGTSKDIWQVMPLCGVEYEMLRVCAETTAHPFASFETNAAAAAVNTTKMVKSLTDRLCPDSFTMILLQDRCSFVDQWRVTFQDIPGYTVMNRAVNHFGEGYAFLQAVYIRAE